MLFRSGFGLGAQRRAIEKNDLPQVQAELAAHLQALRSNAPTDTLSVTTGLIVPKEKVAANGTQTASVNPTNGLLLATQTAEMLDNIYANPP